MYSLNIETFIIAIIGLSLFKTVLTGNERKFKHSKEEIELTKAINIDQNCGTSEITIFDLSVVTTNSQYFDKRQATGKT
jgi:hypothetical protein